MLDDPCLVVFRHAFDNSRIMWEKNDVDDVRKYKKNRRETKNDKSNMMLENQSWIVKLFRDPINYASSEKCRLETD